MKWYVLFLWSFTQLAYVTPSSFDLNFISAYYNSLDLPKIIRGSDADEFRPLGCPCPSANAATAEGKTEEKEEDDVLRIEVIPPVLNRNISGLSAGSPDFVAQKRRRITAEITPEMTHEEIIEYDSARCGITKPNRRQQFRHTLGLISLNNLEVFMENEAAFKEDFNSTYGNYKKGEADNYFLRYMIMFGADQIIDKYSGRLTTIKESHNIIPALNYLMKNKPLEFVVGLFFKSKRFRFDTETGEKVVAAFKNEYPDLGPFQKLAIELINTDLCSFLLPIFNAESEEVAFESLVTLIEKNPTTFSGFAGTSDFIPKLALIYPNYYLKLDMNGKWALINQIFNTDNLEIFEKVVEMYPDVILHISHPDRIHRAGISVRRTLCHIAIERKASKCLKYLIEIVPEMFVRSTADMISALEKAVTSGQEEILTILEELGYTAETRLTTFKKDDLNLIQITFKELSINSLNFYMVRYGLEFVKAQINAIWPTNEQKFEHIFSGEYSIFPKFFIENFQLDVNAIYKYKNLEGNATIFIPYERRYVHRNISLLDYQAPVIVTDPETGLKRTVDNYLRIRD